MTEYLWVGWNNYHYRTPAISSSHFPLKGPSCYRLDGPACESGAISQVLVLILYLKWAMLSLILSYQKYFKCCIFTTINFRGILGDGFNLWARSNARTITINCMLYWSSAEKPSPTIPGDTIYLIFFFISLLAMFTDMTSQLFSVLLTHLFVLFA